MSQRKTPAPRQGNRRPRNTTNALQSNAHRAEDGYAPPSAEDRLDQAFLDEARERGFALAVRCLDCGHYLVNPTSVANHRGPHCAAKHSNEQGAI